MYAVRRWDEDTVIKWLAVLMCIGLLAMAMMPIITPQNSNVGYLVWYYAGGYKLPEPWKGVTRVIATGAGGAIGGWVAAQLGARIGGTIGAFIAGPLGVATGTIAGAA